MDWDGDVSGWSDEVRLRTGKGGDLATALVLGDKPSRQCESADTTADTTKNTGTVSRQFLGSQTNSHSKSRRHKFLAKSKQHKLLKTNARSKLRLDMPPILSPDPRLKPPIVDSDVRAHVQIFHPTCTALFS